MGSRRMSGNGRRVGGWHGWMVLLLSLSAVTAACNSNEASAPTPVPTVAPPPTPPPVPTAPTFSVSGTLFETVPTSSTRVPEAEVQLSGGVATGSIGDGTFTIPNVAAGSYTLRVAKAGYETKTIPVVVSSGDVSGLRIELLPVFRWVDRDVTTELGPGGGSCPGTTRACHTYTFSSHHSGDVRAFIAWNSDIADFDLEYWCGGELVEKRGIRGGTYDEILPSIKAGQTCSIHVLHSGALMRYTLYLRYPY